jgi:hypothetical protein
MMISSLKEIKLNLRAETNGQFHEIFRLALLHVHCNIATPRTMRKSRKLNGSQEILCDPEYSYLPQGKVVKNISATSAATSLTALSGTNLLVLILISVCLT